MHAPEAKTPMCAIPMKSPRTKQHLVCTVLLQQDHNSTGRQPLKSGCVCGLAAVPVRLSSGPTVVVKTENYMYVHFGNES